MSKKVIANKRRFQEVEIDSRTIYEWFELEEASDTLSVEEITDVLWRSLEWLDEAADRTGLRSPATEHRIKNLLDKLEEQ